MDAASGERYGFPRSARITASEEIRSLLRRGKKRKTRHLDVFLSTSPVAHSRLGLVVPKPRAKSQPGGGRVRAAGVRRNRLKRRLREIGRTVMLPGLGAGGCAVDVLLRARPEAYGATFEALREELRQLTEEVCSSER